MVPDPDEGDDRERKLVSAVSREQLMEHTRAIAKWKRLSGSPEEMEAFQYIQQVLDEYGYATNLRQVDGLISLPKNSRLHVTGLGEIECITHSMSASIENLRGQIVYCGSGQPEDYRRMTAQGKIALTDGIAMPGKVKVGEDAGAIAQIHISGDHLHEMCISTVWGSPSTELAHSLPRTPSITIRATDGERIKSLIGEHPVHAEITTVVDTGYRLIPILEANLPGSIETDLFVLFSGHVDSWYYGAMDNGSANATQLEVARLLAQAGSHRRGIRLAFWSGHSHGRYAGSAWYADHYWEELYDRCFAHVNIDSVGGMGATVLTHSGTMQELHSLARSVIAAQAGQDFHGNRIGRAGDHSFMGVGVPAMLMDLSVQPYPEIETPTVRAFAQLVGSKGSGGLGWWWHTPQDTVDKIDPKFLERDARIYMAVIYRLMNLPLLPLDFRGAATELSDLIAQYQAKAGDRFDLSLALERANKLRHELATLYHFVESYREDGSKANASIINQGLMRLSRILTPLNYAEAGRFDHDPAFAQPSLPLLRKINELAVLEPGSNRFRQTLTVLVRRRNAICFALREAIQAVHALNTYLKAEVPSERPKAVN